MPSDNTEIGLDENIEGALCYLLGFVTGVIFYFVEEDNEFVRFHAVQSTITFLGLFVFWMIVNALSVVAYMGLSTIGFAFTGIIGIILTLISILTIILWLVLMLKAYNHERFKLPVVGDIAENFLQ